MTYTHNSYLGKKCLPADIVLAPEWWHRHAGITFDPDFFFHPVKRVEVEQKMEKVLYERWGKYGLGSEWKEKRPQLGAVHLAAGFLLSEMLGCEVRYSDAHPPQVIAANIESLKIDIEKAFKSEPFVKLEKLLANLKSKFGYVEGDINWGGILNIAMDLRGENIFMDMMMNPLEVTAFFDALAIVIERFISYIQTETGTTSISVNRVVKHLKKPVLLHSQCSHTMISEADYESFLLKYDQRWSEKRPYGIHYCGIDPHRMAPSFSLLKHLDFLDVGWGGDVKKIRAYLPHTFLNIRLNPVDLATQNDDDIKNSIIRLVKESANPYLTGICCINMDDKVSDHKIDVIFDTVEALRKEFVHG